METLIINLKAKRNIIKYLFSQSLYLLDISDIPELDIFDKSHMIYDSDIRYGKIKDGNIILPYYLKIYEEAIALHSYIEGEGDYYTIDDDYHIIFYKSINELLNSIKDFDLIDREIKEIKKNLR